MGLTGADPDELLFPNKDGRPLDYSNWRGRVWEPATKAVGMADLNFHDLRRTNATAMVAEGVDVKTAQGDWDIPTLDSHWPSTPKPLPRATDRLLRNLVLG